MRYPSVSRTETPLYRRSRDHILPQERGGRDLLYGDVINIVIMCQACNEIRAAAGHCWAMVACAVAVGGKSHDAIRRTLLAWRPRVDRSPEIDRVAAKRKNQDAIEIGIVVHRVGCDEFIFPADTAAKRVWNLATLRRGGYRGPVPADLR